MELSDKKISL